MQSTAVQASRTIHPLRNSEKRLAVIAIGIAAGYVAALLRLYLSHHWILDVEGRPIATDFIAIWSAGKLVLAGAASSAYDIAHEHAAEVASLGHSFHGALGWLYPPSFLFVAEGLARLPYGWSFAAWLCITAGFYGFATARAAGCWLGAAIALAAPWTLACALVGQNGFLTAGLLALALTMVEERPALCGILVGLLTYKPQFGLLIPIALVAGGHWRVIGWAAATASLITVLSIAVFGPQAMSGFLSALPRTTQSLITNGAAGWQKLQSVYGLVRCLGGGNVTGWAFQGVAIAAAALWVAVLWRSKTPFALKAAGLAVCALLSTPYVFAYDMPMLGVATAFLYRDQRFDRLEYAGLGLAALAMMPVLVAPLPVGLPGILITGAMVARRAALASGRESRAG